MKSTIIALAFFATFANGRILTCTYSDMELAIVGNVYLCRGSVDSTNPSVIERVDGAHSGNRGNTNVEALRITEQAVVEVPRNIGQFFPNLKSLDFSNAQITTIAASSLANLNNLVFFRLFNNAVKSIDSNLFSSNLKLQYIDFSRNALAVVGPNLLGNLKSLSAVEFLLNKCINVRAATPQAIADLNVQLPIRCRAPATTTPAPKLCPVPCSEIEQLRNKADEQAKIIADLQRKLNQSKV
jgi:hypothetical protein